MKKIVLCFLLLVGVGLAAQYVAMVPMVGGGPATPTAPIQVNLCGHAFDGTASFGCAFSSNVTSGDRLIVVCGNYSGNSMGATTISDTQGNSWSQVGTTGANGSSNNSQSWLFTAVAGSSAADTPSCNFQSGHEGNYQVQVVEYSALTLESCPSVCQFQNVNSGSNVTNSMTTTHKDILFTYGFWYPQDNYTVSGFTRESTGANPIALAIFDKGNVAAGAQSVTVARTASAPEHAGLIAMHP